MPKCSTCYGSGVEVYEDDGRQVEDACYHCCNTGYVDDETDYHDRLKSVASTLAFQSETDCRHSINQDPDGEGYDFHAAENMMTAHDYFTCRVYDRIYMILPILAEMPTESQELLIAWNEI